MASQKVIGLEKLPVETKRVFYTLYSTKSNLSDLSLPKWLAGRVARLIIFL